MAQRPAVPHRRTWPRVALGVVVGLAVLVVAPPLAVLAALVFGIVGVVGRHRSPARSRDRLVIANGLLAAIAFYTAVVLFQR